MTASPKPCRCRCSCNDAGPLALAELKLRAAAYASTLTDGSVIYGDTGGMDADYIAPFAQFLPEAVSALGFRMHARLEDGRVVTEIKRNEQNQEKRA